MCWDKKCEHAHPSWWYISIEYLCRFSFEFSCTEKFIGLLKFFQNEDKIWKIKTKKFVCCALETSSTERFSHNHVQLFTFYLKYIPNGLVCPFCLHFTRITRKKTKKTVISAKWARTEHSKPNLKQTHTFKRLVFENLWWKMIKTKRWNKREKDERNKANKLWIGWKRICLVTYKIYTWNVLFTFFVCWTLVFFGFRFTFSIHHLRYFVFEKQLIFAGNETLRKKSNYAITWNKCQDEWRKLQNKISARHAFQAFRNGIDVVGVEIRTSESCYDDE